MEPIDIDIRADEAEWLSRALARIEREARIDMRRRPFTPAPGRRNANAVAAEYASEIRTKLDNALAKAARLSAERVI